MPPAPEVAGAVATALAFRGLASQRDEGWAGCERWVEGAMDSADSIAAVKRHLEAYSYPSPRGQSERK